MSSQRQLGAVAVAAGPCDTRCIIASSGLRVCHQQGCEWYCAHRFSAVSTVKAIFSASRSVSNALQ